MDNKAEIKRLNQSIIQGEEEFKNMTMTLDELCKILDIGRPKALALTKIKGFPCLHCGRKPIIIRKHLSKWIDENLGVVF